MKLLCFLHRLEVPPWHLLFLSEQGDDFQCRKTLKTDH